MRKINFLLLCTLCVGFWAKAETLKEQAQAKITQLEGLIVQAESKDLDTEREKLAVWVATEFIKYADWDEANKDKNEREFGKYAPYASQKTQLAEALPDKERQHVLQLLEVAIAELGDVISGDVLRRPVPLVDWQNVSPQEDQFVSKGKAVFIYDYFSKSHGLPTNTAGIYNDYLGNVDHTPKPITGQLINENMTVNSWQKTQVIDQDFDRIGYTMLWHKSLASWQNDVPEMDKGKALFVSYDIDNPTLRSVWEKAVKTISNELKGEKVTDLGYCLVNEPHWYSMAGYWSQNQGEMNEISTYTLQKFRQWLQAKYNNDMWALYANWQVAFDSFDEITFTIPVPAALRGTPQWYDWCRFNMDRATDWITMLNDAVLASDPTAMTHCKIMSVIFTAGDRHSGIDLEAITELTGYIGDDAKARKRENKASTPEDWETYYAYMWKDVAMMYDFMESVSPNKIHVNSESHFVSTSHWREPDMQEQYVRNVYWLATVLGMDANLTWFWPRKPDGAMEDRFETGSYTESSYAGSCAQQPIVVNAYAKVMMDMNAYSEEIMKLRRLKKAIRVFYSEAACINRQEQMQYYYDLYQGLFFEGTPLGWATQRIIDKQDHELWDVLVIYDTPNVTVDEINSIQNYLDNGGTVVVDNGRSLIKNEYGKVHTVKLNESNGKLYEMGSSASVAQMSEKALALVQEKPAVEVKQSNGLAQKGCMSRVAMDDDGSYLVNLVNISKNETNITLNMRGGAQPSSVVDMLTGKSIGASFAIPSEGLLLLKVVGEASAIDEAMAIQGVRVKALSSAIEVSGAQGRMLSLYDISGRLLAQHKLEADVQTLATPTGLTLVHIEGLGTIKSLVK